MKRILLIIVLSIVLTGCGQVKKKDVEITTTTTTTTTAKVYSERVNNFSDLLKEEMIKVKYIDEDNLKSFQVIKIYKYGHFKKNKYIFDYQVDFKYECKDGTYDCIDFPKMLKPSSELNNTSVIWVNGNEEKISKLSNSISININDNYIFDSEFIE